MKLWDVAAGRELRTLREHEVLVHAVVFSPDGKRLASASKDETVKLWMPPTGNEMHTLTGHIQRGREHRVQPDGARLASAGLDRSLKSLGCENGRLLLTLNGHQERVLPWPSARMASTWHPPVSTRP